MIRNCGEIQVDLEALARNWQVLSKASAPAISGACVKADAYGLGMPAVSKKLWSAGCRVFFVAMPQEAYELRQILPEATIYLMCGVLGGTADKLKELRIRPCLSTPSQLGEWIAAKGEQAALHVDTGIHRAGLSLDEAKALAAQKSTLRRLNLTLLMSHFACADTPEHELNSQQIARFEELKNLFPEIPCSLSNSAAILSGAFQQQEVTRPGIALYGGKALGNKPALDNVVTFYGRVAQIIIVPKGESVGYGGEYRTTGDERIAVISVGYGDGYPRILGGRSKVAVKEYEAPVVGRVSMDQITVNVSQLPEATVAEGDMVELIGANMPLSEIAKLADSIDYEILCRLRRRLPWRYISDSDK